MSTATANETKTIPWESTLRRALAVQEIYLQHKHEGVMNTFIYRRFVKPQVPISERTFQRYLEIPAKKLLRKYYNYED
ncbi:MAG: hypothetical protein D6772_13085 [Bacteroidetes bacterium]|nr:MAG: hypothetical protein D6772_13085 [Bacteroidota bacterium]